MRTACNLRMVEWRPRSSCLVANLSSCAAPGTLAGFANASGGTTWSRHDSGFGKNAAGRPDGRPVRI